MLSETRRGKANIRGFVGIGLVSLDGMATTSEVVAKAEGAVDSHIESSYGENPEVSGRKWSPLIENLSGDEVVAKASPNRQQVSAPRP